MTTDNVLVSLFDESAKIGIRGLRPYAMLAAGQPADAPLEVTWATESPATNVLVVQATIKNTGGAPLQVRGIRWTHEYGTSPALYFPVAQRPHYYATENYRGDYFRAGTVEGDTFFYPLSNQNVETGWSEDSLFPGIFIFAGGGAKGLLLAQASQDRFYPVFRLRGKVMNKDQWFLEIEELVFGEAAITLAAGESLRGDKLMFNLTDTSDPQQTVGPYFEQLRRDGKFARLAKNPLPAQRIYCTWNYDFFADITEEKVLAQLPLLKEHFPLAKFVQLDDGYQHNHKPGQRAMIDLCYGGIPPFDATRFPDGPKALADKIKAAGLRPAIWLGLWASLGSQMLKDHPDWMLYDDTGAAMKFTGWYGGTFLLDPSIPAVRDYLDRTAATVFGDWGFEGLKLDFSSFAFNHKRARYRCGGKTAVELRHELEAIFRRHLPADGFFGWCVVGGTAQPFLSQADYFRNGIDINRGDWAAVRRIAFWTANTNMLLQQRPCLPNIDSIGWSEEFDETRWNTFLNLCAIAGGAIEISGDLRKLDAGRLKRLQKGLELSDPLRRVRCLDLTLGHMNEPPSLWLSEANHADVPSAANGSGSRLAVFNWSDSPATIRLDHADLASWRGVIRDPWTGRLLHKNGLPRTIRLRGQESRLLECGA